jgi:hypothetical protein
VLGHLGRPGLAEIALGRLGRPSLAESVLGRLGRPSLAEIALGRLGRHSLAESVLGHLGRPSLAEIALGRLGRPSLAESVLGRLGRPSLAEIALGRLLWGSCSAACLATCRPTRKCSPPKFAAIWPCNFSPPSGVQFFLVKIVILLSLCAGSKTEAGSRATGGAENYLS